MIGAPEYWLLGVFVALQIGDGATTIVGLRHPALAERNTFAARVMGRWGVAAGAVAFKLLAVAIAIGLVASDAKPIVKITSLAISSAMYAWVVVGNARLCWKYRAGRGS